MKVDLHLHTTFSDGKLNPFDLLKNASENGYTHISITDHDTFSGFLDAKKYLKDFEIDLIPGVEISTMLDDVEIHILAYYFDTDNDDLNNLLKKVYDSRYGRAIQIVHNIETVGIRLEWKDVLFYAGEHKYIGRPHIARALMEKGIVKTITEAFEKFLHNDSPLNVPKYKLDTELVISTIKKANGIAVLAHPGKLLDDNIVYSCIDMGIDGLEVFTSSHDAGQKRLYEQIALEHNLIKTGGTDFHGSDFHYLSYSPPEICINELKTLFAQRGKL